MNIKLKNGLKQVKNVLRLTSFTAVLTLIVGFVFALSSLGCCSGQLNINNSLSSKSDNYDKSPVQYKSFALILVEKRMELTECIPPKIGTNMCDVIEPGYSPRVVRGSGSGTVVKTKNKKSYLITAEHVCKKRNGRKSIKFDGHTFEFKSKSRIRIVDFYGKKRKAKIINTDRTNDICLLEVEGVWADPVPLADEMPHMGEKVYTMSAPLGIFSSGMVLMLTGIYSGFDGIR
tara:strand:- start:30 stop:725 length:696 start_codon:yes stop_codon:yes gene_type:complete